MAEIVVVTEAGERLRRAAVDQDCVKTLDLVFCQGDFRGDEGEAFCRGP